MLDGCLVAGADLVFSQGGGGQIFNKKNRKFCRIFFGWIKLIFRALPKYYRDDLVFGQSFCAAGRILKPKQAKKVVFWPINCVFFGARSLRKISIFWGQSAFRKFLGSVTKNGYLKLVQRGDPFQTIVRKEYNLPSMISVLKKNLD